MLRPRVKSEHRPVRRADGLVRIGGAVAGIAAELPDPDGSVWTLLTAMDGGRTMDEVVAEVVRQCPHRTAADVRLAIRQLATAGHLEEADESVPNGLTEQERERYGRGRALFRWMDLTPRLSAWDAQLRLRQSRVVLVGLGGVGCTAALALVSSGVGHLHCVEPDVVELSNLNRQALYTEADIGHPKLDVALTRLRAHNSDITVTGERTRVDGPAALRALAGRAEVLVLAADEPAEIRSWANRACLATGTAWAHGGYHGPQVSFGVYRPDGGPCHDCALTARRCRDATHPWTPLPVGAAVHAANAVSAGLAGQFVAHAALSLLTGVPALPVNRRYALNLVTLEHLALPGPRRRRPDCPACGNGGIR
ncbi:HesA/MoeB/ThiF family protein [Crossiella sp. CA198]|uniref:HesA/MoeB/ThiF family protein n=1 Tax=Crossiella sp. CA198 TaxID=3455607 RepID=UPI003F8D0E85